MKPYLLIYLKLKVMVDKNKKMAQSEMGVTLINSYLIKLPGFNSFPLLLQL